MRVVEGNKEHGFYGWLKRQLPGISGWGISISAFLSFGLSLMRVTAFADMALGS
jgi:hypothetical protein